MKKRRIFILLLVLSVVFLDIYVNKAYAIDEEKYTNYTELSEVSCGNITGIPSVLPKTISIIYVLIQIAIPVVLVIIGMFDLFQAMTSQKEEDIKKSQGMFVKRLISAALIFFILAAVKLLISAVTKDSENITRCLDCFISNNCVVNQASGVQN